jgi:ribosome-associated protein
VADDHPTEEHAADATLRLDDALKLAGLVATGGEAKGLIQSGRVTVNGVVETRRKRRLRSGDVIGLGDETFEVELGEE